MKSLVWMAAVCLFFQAIACNKEQIKQEPLQPPEIPFSLKVETPIMMLGLPQDSCQLKAFVSNIYNDMTVDWRLKSGPAPVIFDDPHSLTPKVYQLKAGTYFFEVVVGVVRNNQKYESRALLYLGVASTLSPVGEIVIRDLVWHAGNTQDFLVWAVPWDNPQIYSSGSLAPIRLYEQKRSATTWTEIPSCATTSQASNNGACFQYEVVEYFSEFSTLALVATSSKSRKGDTVNLRIAYY